MRVARSGFESGEEEMEYCRTRMEISDKINADNGKAIVGNRSTRSSREMRFAVTSSSRLLERLASVALVASSWLASMSMAMFRFVAGCESSRYAEKRFCADTGCSVGKVVGALDVMDNIASHGNENRVKTRCTISGGFSGRIAR